MCYYILLLTKRKSSLRESYANITEDLNPNLRGVIVETGWQDVTAASLITNQYYKKEKYDMISVQH